MGGSPRCRCCRSGAVPRPPPCPLQQQVAGTLEQPAGPSLGAHALTRTLPAGLGDWGTNPGRLAAEIAASPTRGEVVDAAAIGATIIGLLARGTGLNDAVEATRRLWSGRQTESDLAQKTRPWQRR